MRKLIFLFFIISLPTVNAVTLKVKLTPCFDIKKAETIGQETETILRNEFCTPTISPDTYPKIANSALPRIMTKNFLGVEPPAEWQAVSNNILQTCLVKKNLCIKSDRKEFSNCLKNMIPLLFLQFGPWLGENCPQLNKEVIQNWKNKKEILIQILKDAKSSVTNKS